MSVTTPETTPDTAAAVCLAPAVYDELDSFPRPWPAATPASPRTEAIIPMTSTLCLDMTISLTGYRKFQPQNSATEKSTLRISDSPLELSVTVMSSRYSAAGNDDNGIAWPATS